MKRILGFLIALVMVIKSPTIVCADCEVKYNDIIQPLVIENTDIEVIEVDEGKGDSYKPESGETFITEEKTEHCINLTQEEIDLMAKTVMSEVSYKNIETKQYVASTIINRYLATEGEFADADSIEYICKTWYATNTPYEVTPECYEAVYSVLDYEIAPPDMYWYTEGFACPWGYHYVNIGDSYFSTYSNYND